MRVAVLGAGGFIGSRAVELFHLTNTFDVRPVVRRPASMARSARFGLDCRLADMRDRHALAEAFSGCDAVVHLATGDPSAIRGGVRPVHDAAVDSGVRRIVYLSTASVHGQAPDVETTEHTPLHQRHALPYNNAKVRAEREWSRLASRRLVELVVLRPAIVFGPRSRWVASCAEELLDGRAYLIDDGGGICNTVYVDNLLHAIRLALTVPQAAGGTFFVGDREPLTWREFYQPIARALGIDPASIPLVTELPDFRPGLQDRLRALKSTPLAQFGLRHVPTGLKRSVKAALAAARASDAGTAPAPRGPQPTLEMALLQRCRWQLSWSRAADALGYEPVVPVAEGMRRSIAWLRFAGYPVS